MKASFLSLAVSLSLVACGGKQTTSPGGGSGSGSAETGPVKDTRTELAKRLESACQTAGKKVTECALEDARAELKAGKVSQKDFDLNTKPEILEKNTEEFVKACNVPTMSSRQVRVLEVCFKEETQCGPFLDCLTHLNDKPGN